MAKDSEKTFGVGDRVRRQLYGHGDELGPDAKGRPCADLSGEISSIEPLGNGRAEVTIASQVLDTNLTMHFYADLTPDGKVKVTDLDERTGTTNTSKA